MKTIRYALVALFGVAAAGGLRATETSPSARVDVIFSHPENFTDAARAQRGSDFGLDQNLDDLKRYIVPHAEALVPSGDKLTLTFTDIDLAGEYEPWRTARDGGDVRIIKDIYTPKMDLTFKLTDKSGNVLKEGKRHLSNLTFMMEILPLTLRSEPLAYDKAMVGDWLRSEFAGLKNGM